MIYLGVKCLPSGSLAMRLQHLGAYARTQRDA